MQSEDQDSQRRVTKHRRRVHGRRIGHALRPAQALRQDTLLPKIRVSLPATGNVDLYGLFPIRPDALWLEVGFGGGEHMAQLAAENPNVGFIGCEPFVNGVAQLLKEVEDQGLSNIRIFDDDARLLMERIEAQSIGEVFVLFADPWPKRRHNKRRFISPENLDQIARIMVPNGILHVATDHLDYLDWIMRHLGFDRRFSWLAESADDWRSPGHPAQRTRYSQKAERAGRASYFLRFSLNPARPESP